MCSFIRKHFHNSFGTHTQIVDITAFDVSCEITKLIRIKQNFFTSTDEERRRY